MAVVAVLAPVLNRPRNARPLADSLTASVAGTEHEVRLVFIVSMADTDEQFDACAATGATVLSVEWEPGRGDFARKINYGFRYAIDEGAEWVFVGADDLAFHEGWLDHCLVAHRKAGACVIGTKDLGNPRTMNGWHATHFLVHRDYLECGTIDGDGILLHPGYDHQFSDDECVHTARYRRTYSGSLAVVEHLHPHWGKAAMDATYEKALRATHGDQELFLSRRHMWRGSR